MFSSTSRLTALIAVCPVPSNADEDMSSTYTDGSFVQLDIAAHGKYHGVSRMLKTRRGLQIALRQLCSARHRGPLQLSRCPLPSKPDEDTWSTAILNSYASFSQVEIAAYGTPPAPPLQTTHSPTHPPPRTLNATSPAIPLTGPRRCPWRRLGCRCP